MGPAEAAKPEAKKSAAEKPAAHAKPAAPAKSEIKKTEAEIKEVAQALLKAKKIAEKPAPAKPKPEETDAQVVADAEKASADLTKRVKLGKERLYNNVAS